MIAWFSRAVIGASTIIPVPVSCSLSGPFFRSSPAIVFLDRGHPCFWNFNSTIPVDVLRVKSYVNRRFDPDVDLEDVIEPHRPPFKLPGIRQKQLINLESSSDMSVFSRAKGGNVTCHMYSLAQIM